MNQANDPNRSPDPYDGCPADTMTATIVPARVDCLWATVSIYPASGSAPSLIQHASQSDAAEYAAEFPGKRFVVRIPVPAYVPPAK